MADQPDNSNEQNISDEALLFDESTVLSRSETAEPKEQESNDTSDVLGNTQESGNENIQTFTPEAFSVDHTEYTDGQIITEALSSNAPPDENTRLNAGAVDTTSGEQQLVNEANPPIVTDPINPPADDQNENPGTSEAAVDDFITPLESLSNLAQGNLTEQENDFTETQPLEPRLESPQAIPDPGTLLPEDEPTEVVLRLFAVVDGKYVPVNTLYEPGFQGSGQEFPDVGQYIVLAFDNQGNQLPIQPGGTVTVSIGLPSDSATAGVDYSSPTTLSVTIGQMFEVKTKDDSLSDSGESFTLSLNNDWSNPEGFDLVTYGDKVTTTILDETANDPADTSDNDSAFTLKLFASDDQGNLLLDANGNPVDATQIHEDAANGDTSAHYVVKAVDASGNLLANQPTGEVEVNFKNNGTTSNADYTTSNTTVTLGTAFSATAVDDALADSGETFTVSLVDKSYNQDAANTADGSGTYETVTYDKATVTTTILDETA
ncbi:hypothetical protein, partial [Marinospirillum minutulum]|uniref:hypothetical protein n=1 Tax=Marinospirillum minutulum TaxID=64974 RepID=UPI00056643E2